MVTEFKTKIDLARCWTCSRSASAYPGSSSTLVLSEKLVTDNVVSELKSNRRLLRVESVQGTLEEGHLRVGYPPESTTPT